MFSFVVAMNLQKLQCYVRVLQSYSTLYTEKNNVMSTSVNTDEIQIMSMTHLAQSLQLLS